MGEADGAEIQAVQRGRGEGEAVTEQTLQVRIVSRARQARSSRSSTGESWGGENGF